jgi:hypothetical protein
LEVNLLGVIFSSAIWRALPKKWNACSNGLLKKIEQSIFQNAHIFLFYFFSHEKNLNLSLLFFINGPIKEAHYKRKNNCVNGGPPLIN